MQQCFHARLSRRASFQLSLQVLRADCVARDVVAAAALPPLPAAEGANSQPPPVCVDCGCAPHKSRPDCCSTLGVTFNITLECDGWHLHGAA
jgi:hypothetical protein